MGKFSNKYGLKYVELFWERIFWLERYSFWDVSEEKFELISGYNLSEVPDNPTLNPFIQPYSIRDPFNGHNFC